MVNEKLLEHLVLKPPDAAVTELLLRDDNATGLEITRCDANTLSYDEFYWSFMHKNWPVILTNVATNWECRHNWILRMNKTNNNKNNNNNNDNSNNKNNNNNNNKNNNNSITIRAVSTKDKETTYTAINFDYLRNRIGNLSVPVADCNKQYYNSHENCTMNFYDFLQRWQAETEAGTATETKIEVKAKHNNNAEATITTNTTVITDKPYLKDWHLKATLSDYDFYCVPKQFASDWLNEQLVFEKRDDYRFVYMGPKDTWTPFHADVFGSFSWSTNIFGCKKWLMLPPGEEHKLEDRLGNTPFCINEQLLQQHNVSYFTLLQTENEAIFVPSGWYHQVWNLTDTISVNHNWFNGCNIKNIWLNLQTAMQAVCNEIEDCKQMDNYKSHCQTMLRASFGLNYLDFIEHLEFIVQRRLTALLNNNNLDDNTVNKYTIFDKYTLNDYHIKYDLLCIASVLELMLQDQIITENLTLLYHKCLRMLTKIQTQKLKV